jgi:energy-coupling factor transporter ATP-binding protein EcfA2
VDAETGPVIVLESRQQMVRQQPGIEGSVSGTLTAGERLVICGPSGSGKSTLLRCINGLEPHQSGRITVAGTLLTRQTAVVGARAARRRPGIPIIQSVSAPDGARELHAGTHVGPTGAEGLRLKLRRSITCARFIWPNTSAATQANCQEASSNASP